MKHTYLYTILLAASVITACTNTEDVVNFPESSLPVSFSTYMASSIRTRAAKTGSIDSPQTLAQKGGFGIFGYYTVDQRYDAGQSVFTPNFFYNQQITGTDDTTPEWTYAPIKYWPNSNSLADNKGAVGENKGLVSFFAYAPYADATATTGITAMSANTATGDPTITYKLASDGDNVDLLWGTSGTTESIAGTWEGRTDDNTGETLTGGTGKVNANLTKQTTDGRVKFNFKHALAKLGLKVVLDIDKYIDGISYGIDGGELEDDGLGSTKTKVTVESIQIKSVDGSGVKSQGILNLATGKWTVDSSSPDATINSIVKGDELNEEILDPGVGDDENSATQYNSLTTDGNTWAWTKTGVTTTVQDVYGTEKNPIVFIPTTTPKFLVTITYYVNTKDGNLLKHASRVKNTITKEITFSKAVDAGKEYNLVLHLGLTIVKFSVEVAGWDDSGTTETVNLPINVGDATPAPRVPDEDDDDVDDTDTHQYVNQSTDGKNASIGE